MRVLSAGDEAPICLGSEMFDDPEQVISPRFKEIRTRLASYF